MPEQKIKKPAKKIKEGAQQAARAKSAPPPVRRYRAILFQGALVFVGTLVALIGISRIDLGQHWASDVLGAYLLGSLTLVVIIQFYRWGKTRFFVHQPVAAAPQQA